MSARPIETFQSEGWYRPTGARSQHYFRLNSEGKWDMGDGSVVSVCGNYGSGGGIRPFLAITSASGRCCQKCSAAVTAQLFAPQAEGWFPVSPDLGTTEGERK